LVQVWPKTLFCEREREPASLSAMAEQHHHLVEDKDSDDEGHPAGSGRAARDAGGPKAACQLCCCCLLLIIVIVQGCLAFGRNGGCVDLEGTAEGQLWDPIVPPVTTCQKQFRLLWSEVNVFNPAVSNVTTIGQWTSMNFFGMYTKYGFQNTEGVVVVEARTPWGLYFGKAYEIWRCDSAGPVFKVVEDYWAEPWFSWGMEKRYLITNMETKTQVATVAHSADFFAGWQASFSTMQGVKFASLDQHVSTTGWFEAPIWSVSNSNEALVPSAVVSFMAAIYDMEQDEEA